MTERLTIQMAYHLWAEGTSGDWSWTEDKRVKDQLRCYRCGLPRDNPFHSHRSEAQDHPYEPGVLIATDLMGSDLPPRKPGTVALEE